MPTVAQLLRETAAALPGDDARAEAELLLAHCLQKPRSWLYAHADDEVDADGEATFAALRSRRITGEPVAQLLGRRDFWSLPLAVTPDTLIPRPDTERLVELALERLPLSETRRVLDLGTGTGAIALAIASERPRARVVAVDASEPALAVARANTHASGLGARVSLLAGDWFAPVVGEVFDLVASNPPYIADDDPHLSQGDLRFEPRSALAAGADGLDDLRRIVASAPAHLVPGGWLLVEHGWEQGAAVRALFAAAGFTAIETARDIEERERITLGQRP
jgi:release factor glutamine methyltransferase